MNRTDIPEPPEKEPASARAALPALTKLWNLRNAKFLRTFENIVYSADLNGTCYLRLTSQKRRSIVQVQSELIVLEYLQSTDISATTPVPDNRGRQVAEIESMGDLYIACVFKECEGLDFQSSTPTDVKRFWRVAGETMGQLHSRLLDFERTDDFERFDWRSDRWDRFSQLIPEKETEAWSCYNQVATWLANLEPCSQSFGLIHGDFTVNNLRYKDHQISLFDFDGCCDHWYGYEIACFLHYFLLRSEHNRQTVFEEFVTGYSSAKPVTEEFVNDIEQFTKMKLLRSHMIVAEHWGFDNLTKKQAQSLNFRRELLLTDSLWH